MIIEGKRLHFMKLNIKLDNKKSKAQSLIEYALILAMVTVIAVVALQLLGQNMSNTLKQSAETINTGADDVQRKACESFGGTWTPGSTEEAGTCELNDTNN